MNDNAFGILLIDDHSLFRAGLRLILETSPEPPGEIVEAGGLAEALAYASPNVALILLDILMPGMNGIDGIALLRRRWPKARILVLSAVDRPDLAQRALAEGALAFLSKTAQPEQIRAEVRAALAGQAVAAPGASPRFSREAPLRGEERLSSRQLEVLELMCRGLPNKVIAARLDLSGSTVRNHVSAILRHFSASTRTEAVMRAQRLGVVAPSEA